MNAMGMAQVAKKVEIMMYTPFVLIRRFCRFFRARTPSKETGSFRPHQNASYVVPASVHKRTSGQGPYGMLDITPLIDDLPHFLILAHIVESIAAYKHFVSKPQRNPLALDRAQIEIRGSADIIR